MTRDRMWMAVCLLLTLLAGTSAGVVADRTVLKEDRPRPEHSDRPTIHFECVEGELDRPPGYYEERRARMLDRWQERFELEPEQRSELLTIFREHGSRAGDLWNETRERYCGLGESLRGEVDAVLDEGQRRALHEYREERQRRHSARAVAGASGGSCC